ncbi:MAG: hypothetical protein A3G34_01910 [Candidatus Lindowbacteria bacterium RIFCSPLOWO2_12_FULL_62_27]|nr:MAG: hypothetical protein A3I06_11430 [Candidatus Lindowbacteria bacterium RIFCSPLOWO2_02_FULL_62_12]OGH59064.1 MAG: hypothetical protein A3G34_01910 [Candidatus Lindowbacteria bacterium RIFCSPLOWO2_12_FULL_62_27]
MNTRGRASFFEPVQASQSTTKFRALVLCPWGTQMKIPEWIRYDPEDPKQRHDARIALAILALGAVLAVLRQFGLL